MRTLSIIRTVLFALVLAGLQPLSATAVEVPLGLVQDIQIVGNRRVEAEAIRVHVQSRLYAPIDPEVVQRDVVDIYGMGFFDDVQVSFEPVDGRSTLTYRVVERPLIKEVKIDGEDEVSEEDLQAAIKIRPYTILDLQKVFEGIEEARKLYDQAGYKDAKIEFETSDPGTGEVVVTFKIDEGKIVRIQNIDFEGNVAFTDRKLRGLMQTKEGWIFSFLTGAGNLDPEVLKSDLERLTAWYYENGYVEVKVDEPAVERTDKGIQVLVKIDEGKQFTVGEVGLEGEDLLLDEDKLQKRLGLKAGDTFKASRLREDIFALTDLYGDLGYAFANIEPLTAAEPGGSEINVRYKVDKGPQVYFNRIEIAGNTKTRDHVIRRELLVREQRRFSGSLLKASRERVQRLGFFDEVNITTERAPGGDQIDLVVDVKERQTGAFTAGAGFSSADNFIFNARISENNLFGSGNRVTLNADIGSIRQDLSIEYTDPYFLDTYVTATVSGFSFELDFDDFTRRGRGASIRLLYPFTRLGFREFLGLSLDEVRFGLEYRFEQAEIDDVDSFFRVPSIEAEQGDSFTSSVIPTLVRNTLNHPFDPTNGSFTNFSAEFAALGGDTNFVKVEARTRIFAPLFRYEPMGVFVGSIGARVGFGFGQEGRSGTEMPLFERFFPGGINSVRGFRSRTLGPREPVFDPNGNIVDDTPVGGSSQAVFTTEFIFPLVEALGLRGVIFADAGNAWNEDNALDFGDMRYAAGWGVRWLSPIGPLRIEIGYPLDQESGEDSNVFQFSFGAPI